MDVGDVEPRRFRCDEWSFPLRYVTIPVASRLTGLSTGKLREWSGRRTLLPADVRPKQRGSPAECRWRRILMSRIAALLGVRFDIEFQAYKSSFAQLRQQRHKQPFVTLWGHWLILRPNARGLVEDGATLRASDILLVPADAHLHVLPGAFALPDAGGAYGQFDLFPLLNLRRSGHAASISGSTGRSPRRSA